MTRDRALGYSAKLTLSRSSLTGGYGLFIKDMKYIVVAVILVVCAFGVWFGSLFEDKSSKNPTDTHPK